MTSGGLTGAAEGGITHVPGRGYAHQTTHLMSPAPTSQLIRRLAHPKTTVMGVGDFPPGLPHNRFVAAQPVALASN